MPTYVMLLNFTDRGIRNVKDSPKRADAFKNTAKKAGAIAKEVFLDTRTIRRRHNCRGAG